MAKRKLTKHNVVGNRAIFYFKKPNGTIVRDIRSLEYFASLKERGSKVPTHPDGYEYLFGEVCPEYDTPDGDLPDDAYAELPDNPGKIVVRLREHPMPTNREVVADASEIDAERQVEVR